MSSKQINFFLLKEDLPDIQDFFNSNECISLKRKAESSVLPERYDFSINNENLFQFYILDPKYKNMIFLEHLEYDNTYYIDIFRSYCIEFSIGAGWPSSLKEIHSSRLYYKTEYYDNEILIRKDDEFCDWANKIIKKFAKSFLEKASKYPKDLVTKRFMEWMKTNNAQRSIDGTKFVFE